MQSDQRYLRQPRGPGNGYSVKMPTPSMLVGVTNPRTEKPYGKTIHEGLNTRSLREARRERDLLPGQIRADEASASGEDKPALSLNRGEKVIAGKSQFGPAPARWSRR